MAPGRLPIAPERKRKSPARVADEIMADPEPGQRYVETITALDPLEARAFVTKFNGTRNLYYSVNPTRGPTDKKASKTNIAAIEFALADCDPRDDETPEAANTKSLRE